MLSHRWLDWCFGMEKLRQQVEALEVHEQQQLMVELIGGSAPEVQLSLLLPSVTAAARWEVLILKTSVINLPHCTSASQPTLSSAYVCLASPSPLQHPPYILDKQSHDTSITWASHPSTQHFYNFVYHYANASMIVGFLFFYFLWFCNDAVSETQILQKKFLGVLICQIRLVLAISPTCLCGWNWVVGWDLALRVAGRLQVKLTGSFNKSTNKIYLNKSYWLKSFCLLVTCTILLSFTGSLLQHFLVLLHHFCFLLHCVCRNCVVETACHLTEMNVQ